MIIVYWQTQLYNFLRYCEDQVDEKGLQKSILDCGAGGQQPSLGLFKDFGYSTTGIEISDAQIDRAREYASKHGFDLGIQRGDMRNLPFKENSFSFAYSYNSIFHMSKQDIFRSIDEMMRVVKRNGLIFFNLLTTRDFRHGEGEEIGPGEFLQDEHGDKVIHSYFDPEELNGYLSDVNVLLKNNRSMERQFDDKKIQQGYIDYIIEKP
jgi:ubiquinone/menaquinone biosynthesis C-methylase UbiE